MKGLGPVAAYAVVVPQAQTPREWTTWTLITRYKVAAIIGALLLAVVGAINRGCQDAFTNDVEDTVNVVDAIKEQ